MRLVPSAIGVLACLALPLSAAAAADEEPIDAGALSELSGGSLEQVTGFLVDRTITSFGAEFLRDFAQVWRTQTMVDGIDLTVIERPSARWGSTVIVEYKNRPIAKVLLQSGSSAAIRPIAANVARYAAGRVADGALLGLLSRDPDLGAEELP